MIDFLIIGHGLAGASLAYSLRSLGASVSVIDKPSLSSCSRIAAGLINPIAVRRLSMSWRADEFIPFLEKFYPELENKFNCKFFHRNRMLKPYGNETDREQWHAKKGDEVSVFLGEDIFCEAPVINPFGCMEILHSGWLDTNAFLDACRTNLADSYHEEHFDHSKLELLGDGIRYKDIEAKQIVFCEGFLAMQNNPFFSNIPFALTKGQVLDVEIDGFECRDILNRGAFVLPQGAGKFRIGATYSWRDHSEDTSDAASEELLNKAANLLQSDISIIKAKAGIRPTVRDRRPVMGRHPKHKNISIFNGLGSKAVMFAPLLSLQMAQHLLNDSQIFEECKLSRFSS